MPEYGPYDQRSSKSAAPQFDLNAAIAAFLMQQQAAQTDRTALQRERSFGHHVGNKGPGGLTTQSEWEAMFPDSAASRLTPEARMASGGATAMNQWSQLGQNPSVNPQTLNELMDLRGQMHNPESTARSQYGIGQVMPEPAGAPPAPMPTHAIPGGIEGMINPHAPNKYADANAFRVMSGAAPNVPPGAYATDETGNAQYRKTTPKKKGSSFGFGAPAARPFSF